MKLIHIADLHLGKRVNAFSMLEEQEYILKEILRIVDEEKPDGILIAGDVYDKSVPSAEAVSLLDWFLVQMAEKNQEVFLISGNHDSPERLAFGNRLMDEKGIHFSPVYGGKVTPFSLRDSFGSVNIFLLPFIKPSHVRRFYPEEEIETYSDAMRIAIENMEIPAGDRNVLVAHAFVTGAVRSESEELSVGGMDNVDASVFDAFDYVALGHLHGPQKMDSDRIRYCGSPLKYSFSESGQKKSVTILELMEKGNFHVRQIPLVPLHDMAEIRGTYAELTAKSTYEKEGHGNEYVHITLTDEEDIPNALSNLRMLYPYLMKLDYDNTRTRTHAKIDGVENAEDRSPSEWFSVLFEQQNGSALTEEQVSYIQGIVDEIWGGQV